MKKITLSLAVATLVFAACQKSSQDSITVSASTTSASIGQIVTVSAATNSANVISWSVTPPANASAVYTVTTEKTNYFTFTAPGTYIVGVRARHLDLDSIHNCNHLDSLHHHTVDSIWNHHIEESWHQHGHDKGDCKKGKDSASVVITVK